MEQAACLSDQRARLTVWSPNKPELKFSMLQIPKHHSQVKGKIAGAATLRFLPCTLLISVVKPLMNHRRKGKKQSNRKNPPEASLLTQQSLPRHRQNSQDKHSTKFIKIYGSFLPGSHKSALLWGLSRYFESDSLLSVQPEGKQGPGGLWPMALAEAPQLKELMPSIVSPWVSTRQCSQNPPSNLQLHKLLKGAVLECAAHQKVFQRAKEQKGFQEHFSGPHLCSGWMRNARVKPWESNVQSI